jgi:acyl-CoA reductase-like NAD-dependent aldehyde dehydrogenase
MLEETYPYYLANKPVHANTDLEVTDKYSGEVVSRVAMAGEDAIREAFDKAEAAREAMQELPAFHRQEVLNHCVRRFTERQEELAMALCIEAGKPINDSRGEAARLVDTFRVASEESVRMNGESMPLDISPRAKGYSGTWKRYPIGVCSFISPFNFPLNLAAHKVAPALAVGCPFVLKPASLTPIGALIIGETLAETDLPEGAFSILPAKRTGAALFTEHPSIKLMSFTGSPVVGWDLKARSGKAKVVLELGGNAGCIVDEDADVDDAVDRIVIGAFYQSGQSCISVQRVLVHEKIYDVFRKKLVNATTALTMGDPKEEGVFIGPMISEKEAQRLHGWIQEAVGRGARVLCGGHLDGTMLEATLLESVPRDTPVYAEEAFGPVAVLSPFKDFEAALDEVNDSAYGLQAGVFTRDIYKAHRAWDKLEVGGIVIGDVPSWRVDHMPYGGVKDSGLGREGIRWAMEDMSEIRLMILRRPH